MNKKRSIAFGVGLYLSTFLIFGAVAMLGGYDFAQSTPGYIANWVFLIILTLFFAKWYFRMDEPTKEKGFLLGLVAIGVGIVFDLLFILTTYFLGESLDMFVEMYTSWQFYATIAIVILTCTYAGYEFDATYTYPDAEKKS